MDTDPVSFKEFDDYLRDLERINVLTLAYRVLTLAYRPTLLWLKRALRIFQQSGRYTAGLGHDARQCGPPHREPQRR